MHGVLAFQVLSFYYRMRRDKWTSIRGLTDSSGLKGKGHGLREKDAEFQKYEREWFPNKFCLKQHPLSMHHIAADIVLCIMPWLRIPTCICFCDMPQQIKPQAMAHSQGWSGGCRSYWFDQDFQRAAASHEDRSCNCVSISVGCKQEVHNDQPFVSYDNIPPGFGCTSEAPSPPQVTRSSSG